MSKLWHYCKIYILIIKHYIMRRAQYRADFIISLLGLIARDISGFFALWIIFRSIPLIAGWNYHELIFLYGFSLLALAPLQMFFDHLWDLNWHIIRGTFIKYYLKPLNTLFYYSAEVFDIKAFGQITLGITGIVYASHHLALQWSWLKIIFLITLILSASLVMIAITIASSSITFWTLKSSSISEFILRMREISRYPLSIFNNFFKFIFTYVIPIGFIAYYPVKLLIKTGEIEPIAFASPFIGIVLLYFSLLIWNIGTKRYTGTGS